MLKFIDVDGFLLGKTQKLCDSFTLLTGHTKFQLEMWAIVTETALYWVFAVQSANMFVFVVAIIVILSNSISVHRVKNAEREFLKNNKLLWYKKVANHKWFRYLVLTILAIVYVNGIIVGFSLLAIFFLLWSVALIVEMYISICTPLPPGKSKIKKRLGDVAFGLKNRPATLSPAPVPTDDL